MDDRLSAFTSAGPASAGQLEGLERTLDQQLPRDYVEFVSVHDGGEGWVGDHYLVLWNTRELIPYNREYGFPEGAPSLIAFGTDGGGEAFAFDTRTSPFPVVMVPLIGMSDDEAIQVADSFDQLLDRMTSVESLF